MKTCGMVRIRQVVFGIKGGFYLGKYIYSVGQVKWRDDICHNAINVYKI